MSVQTVHFTVGKDAGIIVMNIAQEHLLYTNNVEKALKTITDSLMGCPMDLALKILVGDYVVDVDVDTQEFLVCKRDVEHKDFPKIDVFKWCRNKTIELTQNCDDLNFAIKSKAWNVRGKRFHIDFSYQQIFDFIGGDDKEILDELRNDEQFGELTLLVKVTKDLIEKSINVSNTIDWLTNTYPEKFTKISDSFDNIYNRKAKVAQLVKNFQSMLKTEWTDIIGIAIDEEYPDVTNYIEAAREIDEIVSKGIEPVNIMDNYSAGWLSPSGEFYGLNGEIANMLHNQIADALQEKGIIPTEDEDGNVHPDAWLEQQGWVRIHGSNVQFAGCLNKQLGKQNVNLTNVQIKMIYEYIALKHNGIMKLGWRLEPTSAAKFQMLGDNLPFMYQKYFEF